MHPRVRFRSGVGLSAVLLSLTACDRPSATSPISNGPPVERAVPSTAQGPWQEFHIPGVAASVLMPKVPEQQEVPTQKDGTMYACSAPGTMPVLEFQVLVYSPPISLGQTVDEALDIYIQRYVKFPPGDVLAGVKVADLPSRGFVTKDADGKPVWEGRVIAVGSKWVDLRVSSPAADPSLVKKFFDSFKLSKGP